MHEHRTQVLRTLNLCELMTHITTYDTETGTGTRRMVLNEKSDWSVEYYYNIFNITVEGQLKINMIY